MFDLFREIRQSLRSNRVRTFLTGFSVAWGVFMLIILLGVARGVTNSFNANLNASTSSELSLFAGMTTKPWHGYPVNRSIELREADGPAIGRENPGEIADCYYEHSIDSLSVVGPRGTASSVRATYPEAMDMSRIKILAGRMLNERDLAENRRVMILSMEDAARLFDDADAVGQTVSFMGLSWTVVGVINHDWSTQSYIPYTTYKSLTGNDDKAGTLILRLQNLRTAEEGDSLERRTIAIMARRHEFDPSDDNAIWTWNRFSNSIRTASAADYLRIAVWVIGLLTLLTGIVGVSNIMFVSVRERTHEIGIRRAIGAKPRSIMTQVLAESVAITAIFGYIGIVAGMVILQIIDATVGSEAGLENPTVDISIAVEVTLALIAAGFLAGYFPARKAIKVKPVEALRDE